MHTLFRYPYIPLNVNLTLTEVLTLTPSTTQQQVKETIGREGQGVQGRRPSTTQLKKKTERQTIQRQTVTVCSTRNASSSTNLSFLITNCSLRSQGGHNPTDSHTHKPTYQLLFVLISKHRNCRRQRAKV